MNCSNTPRLQSLPYGGLPNTGIRDWPEILAGDEVLTTAILDRLMHSHILDIKGRSYRLRDLERLVAQQA